MSNNEVKKHPKKRCQPVLVYKTRVPSHLNINIKPEKNHETQFSMNKISNNEIEKILYKMIQEKKNSN
jgi:hypothetical protein